MRSSRCRTTEDGERTTESLGSPASVVRRPTAARATRRVAFACPRRQSGRTCAGPAPVRIARRARRTGNLWDAQATAGAGPVGGVQPARRIPHPAAPDRARARDGRRGLVVGGGAVSANPRIRSASALSLAGRPPGRAGHSDQHRHLDHDGRLDRLCDPADDPNLGFDPILPAHPRQFRPRPCHPVDARDLPRHLLLLHRSAARGPVAPDAVRPRRHRGRRDGARAGLRRLAYLLHPPHLERDQRQPHRRPHRSRNRRRDRRADALSPARRPTGTRPSARRSRTCNM